MVGIAGGIKVKLLENFKLKSFNRFKVDYLQSKAPILIFSILAIFASFMDNHVQSESIFLVAKL